MSFINMIVLSVDIDECSQNEPCDINAMCINTNGGFECICNSGFFGNGSICHGKKLLNGKVFHMTRLFIP